MLINYVISLLYGILELFIRKVQSLLVMHAPKKYVGKFPTSCTFTYKKDFWASKVIMSNYLIM